MGEGGGETNISKNVNNFLSTNPTTLILSSLVSEFCKTFKSDIFVCVCVSGVVGGDETKTVCLTVK